MNWIFKRSIYDPILGAVWISRSKWIVPAKISRRFEGNGWIRRCGLYRRRRWERFEFFLRALPFLLWAFWDAETSGFRWGLVWDRIDLRSTERLWIWACRRRRRSSRAPWFRRSRKEWFRFQSFRRFVAWALSLVARLLPEVRPCPSEQCEMFLLEI